MSGFWSPETGDFDTYFMTTTDLIDRYATGGLWSVGNNTYGQLGDSTNVAKSSPVQTIARGTIWKQVSTGFNFSASIKEDGTLWGCGYNLWGQLGDNSIANRYSPVQTVMRGVDWKQVSCGYYFTATVKTDGSLWMCGYNLEGELGDNTLSHRSSPVQTIARGNNWLSVDCGSFHTGSIKTDGTLWLWGYNFYGQLGNNTSNNSSSPVQTVAYSTNWKQISCGGYNTAAIKTDGTLWLWGYNKYGQIGDNTSSHRSSPVQTITRGTNWKQVSCGGDHCVAIKTDGSLWAWGNNQYGQLGDNTVITGRSSPVQTIAGGTNWKQVSCNNWTSAGIKTDGTLWIWGNNTDGQIGDNTRTSKSSPVQTVMSQYMWKQVSVSNNFVSAIITSDLGN